MSRKNDPEFTKLVQDFVSLDEATGKLTFTDLYANLCLNICWRKGIIVVPYSHVVWLLKHGRWPLTGYHIDHINDCALDNRPENLQEITEEQNHKKRRGRKVNRNYGTGKYGYGICVGYDKRDKRYYVCRHLSRGHGNGELKTKRASLGGFNTIEEAEAAVKVFITEIVANGLDYTPVPIEKNPRRDSIRLDAVREELRALRASGLTIREIAKLTDLPEGSIYSRIRDLEVDNRYFGHPQKLNEEKVRQIRAMHAQGQTLKSIASNFGICTVMVNHVLQRKAWAWVE